MHWLYVTLLLAQFLQTPTITATWQGDTLIVSADPGSLYLVGGNRQDRFIDRSGPHVTLPAYGVDANVTPLDRTALVLKNTNGQVIATLPIPLKPDRYQVIMPIVVRLIA